MFLKKRVLPTNVIINTYRISTTEYFQKWLGEYITNLSSPEVKQLKSNMPAWMQAEFQSLLSAV